MIADRKRRRLLREVEKFEARQFREQAGMSVAQCAIYFNVSIATMFRGLADMREKFGPEKLPPRLAGRQRQRVISSNDRSAIGGT